MVAFRFHKKSYKIFFAVILSITIILLIGLATIDINSDLATADQLKETFESIKYSFKEAGLDDFLKIPGNLVKWSSDTFTTTIDDNGDDFIEEELENDEISDTTPNQYASEYGFDYGETFKTNVETIWKGLFTPLYYVYSTGKDEHGKGELLYKTTTDAALSDLFEEGELEKFDSLLDISKDYDKMFKSEEELKKEPIKACFMSLVRNEELEKLIPSIQRIEERFNKNYNYTYIFFNDVPFTEEFEKKVNETINPKSKVKYIQLPEEMWSYPDFIDEEEAANTREKMKKIIYGGSESYRHMCRFNSKWFYHHPAMAEFDYYWRIEPNTGIYCDIDYDIFEYMNNNKFVYGFTISLYEWEETVPDLWPTTKNFIQQKPHFLNNNNLIKFISDDDGEFYNQCHFWSNFEIANLNFYRSKQYQTYVEYLDRTGIFYYERAGDAPVHSIAASLFLPKEAVTFLNQVSYQHPPFLHCPIEKDVYKQYNCDCNQNYDFTFQGYSCGIRYYDANNIEKPAGYERFQHKKNKRFLSW
ncbi:hypothetical protein ACO0SA_003938 [Hanseniaspora valbyensis]